MNELVSISTKDLKMQLAAAIGVTAKNLAHMATIWRELEYRGEDLSDLRRGLMVYMPLIAAGKLDPEVVVCCAGQAMLLKAMSGLPLFRQRELLTSGVRVACTHTPSKEMTVALDNLSAYQVRMVFAREQVRTPGEQVLLQAPEPVATVRGLTVTVTFTATESALLKGQAIEAGKTLAAYVRDCALGVV